MAGKSRKNWQLQTWPSNLSQFMLGQSLLPLDLEDTPPTLVTYVDPV
jgi:hypothetical protein